MSEEKISKEELKRITELSKNTKQEHLPELEAFYRNTLKKFRPDISEKELKARTDSYVETVKNDIIKSTEQLIFPELSKEAKDFSNKSAETIKGKAINIVPRTLTEDMKNLPTKLLPQYLVKEEKLSDGKTYAVFEIPNGNAKLRSTFLLPAGITIKDIISGGKLKKCLVLLNTSAIEQKTDSPIVAREFLAEALGRRDVDNTLMTLHAGSYDIENNEKGKKYYRELGHFVENVKFHGVGKNSHIQAQIRKKDSYLVDQVKASDKVSGPYIEYPASYRNNNYSSLANKIYDFWLLYVKDYDKKGKMAFPRIIRKFIIEQCGVTEKDIKKHGEKEIRSRVEAALDELKLEINYKYSDQIDPNNTTKSWFDWKIRIFPVYSGSENTKIIDNSLTKQKSEKKEELKKIKGNHINQIDSENREAFTKLLPGEKKKWIDKATEFYKAYFKENNLTTEIPEHAIMRKAGELYAEYLRTL